MSDPQVVQPSPAAREMPNLQPRPVTDIRPTPSSTLASRSVQPFGYGGGGGHDHHDPRPSGDGRFLGSISLAKKRGGGDCKERRRSLDRHRRWRCRSARFATCCLVATLDNTNVYTLTTSRIAAPGARRRKSKSNRRSPATWSTARSSAVRSRCCRAPSELVNEFRRSCPLRCRVRRDRKPRNGRRPAEH